MFLVFDYLALLVPKMGAKLKGAITAGLSFGLLAIFYYLFETELDHLDGPTPGEIILDAEAWTEVSAIYIQGLWTASILFISVLFSFLRFHRNPFGLLFTLVTVTLTPAILIGATLKKASGAAIAKINIFNVFLPSIITPLVYLVSLGLQCVQREDSSSSSDEQL